MAINFPDTNGQATDGSFTYTYEGKTWTWDGVSWNFTPSTFTESDPIVGAINGLVKANGDGLISAATAGTDYLSSTDDIDTHLNKTSSITDGHVLSWDTSLNSNQGGYAWVPQSGGGTNYSNSDVDTHLNVSPTGPTSGHVLSWNGSSYFWIPNVNQTLGVSSSIPPDGHVLSWSNAANNNTGGYAWVPQSSGGSGTSSITWTLDGDGTDYIFSGPGIETGNTNDPELFLVRGQTYIFSNQSSSHPLKLKTYLPVVGQPSPPNYTSGVSESGNVTTFTVPMDAPDTLYYQCTTHPTMGGTINISGYTNSDVNTLLNNTGSITDGHVLSWSDAANNNTGGYVWVEQSSGGGGGGTLSSRTTFNTNTDMTTADSKILTVGASASGYITGFKSYSLLKINISQPDLWVTIYTDPNSMASDASRLYTQDPNPSSGVIAEFITDSSNYGQDIIITPTVIGFNAESTPDDKIYLKVSNIGSSNQTSDFTIQMTVLQLEA